MMVGKGKLFEVLVDGWDSNGKYCCEESLKEWNEQLNIHHIDYVKENSDPVNLISLCRSCNAKVNFGRENWTKFFQQKLKLCVG